MDRVSHVIKESLVHGRYYNVYVTQVNTYGLESEKSIPSLIRVGDVIPPAVPTISLDTSYGTNGFLKSNGFVNIKVQWDVDTTDDDLAGYYLGYTTNFPNWNGDGVYDTGAYPEMEKVFTLSNTVNTYVITNVPNHKYVCIGIVAYDYSRNMSSARFIKVLAEDNSAPVVPITAPDVVGGVWQEFVTVKCVDSYEVEKILIYRDDPTTVIPEGMSNPVGSMLFLSGAAVTFTDNLRVVDGLTHYYSYAYVDFNGNISPRSPYSAAVTAKSIDTTLIDKDTFKALSEAWTSDFIRDGGVYDIEKLKSDLVTQTANIKDLSDQLSVVQTNYSDLFDKYQLLVNQYDLISASVNDNGDSIDYMKSQISLNSSLITQKVSQTTLDSTANSIRNAYTSLYYQNSNQISTIVSNLNNNALAYTSISQLANQIQLKVSKKSVISAINLSPETIQLDGKRIHITGDTLFDKDIRVLNNIYAGNTVKTDNGGWTTLTNGLICQYGYYSFDAKGNNVFQIPVRFYKSMTPVSITITPNTHPAPTWGSVSWQALNPSSSGFDLFLDTTEGPRVPFVGIQIVSWMAFGY